MLPKRCLYFSYVHYTTLYTSLSNSEGWVSAVNVVPNRDILSISLECITEILNCIANPRDSRDTPHSCSVQRVKVLLSLLLF